VVPFTLQTFFVILSGNLLGARYGTISQVIYLIVGLIGLPIFAYGGGPGYILQPTFGYLLASPLAAYIAGIFIQSIFQQDYNSTLKKQSLFLRIFFSNLISSLVIFLIGVCYLYIILNFYLNRDIGFDKACWIGFIIFLPGDIVKVFIASLVTIRMRKIVKI